MASLLISFRRSVLDAYAHEPVVSIFICPMCDRTLRASHCLRDATAIQSNTLVFYDGMCLWVLLFHTGFDLSTVSVIVRCYFLAEVNWPTEQSLAKGKFEYLRTDIWSISSGLVRVHNRWWRNAERHVSLLWKSYSSAGTSVWIKNWLWGYTADW